MTSKTINKVVSEIRERAERLVFDHEWDHPCRWAIGVSITITDIRSSMTACLRARIEREVASGALPPGTGPSTFAELVMAIAQGMLVLARDGIARALLAIVDTALSAWLSD